MSATPLPTLDDFDYQPVRFLDSDSKMSLILLANDRQQRPLVLKIARVDQNVRADVNRQAIHNTVTWFKELGSNRGIADLYPIASSRSTDSVYLAQLQTWENKPEFLVMEYLGGGSLRDFVGHQRLPVEVTLQISFGVAQSLAFIHKHGCVHRDLKPENILFRTPPTISAPKLQTAQAPMPILIDFGVAARQGENRFVSGSRLWMAPELQEAYERRPLPVDAAWDVYALGLIVCYMLSGLLPRRRSFDFASYESYRQRALTVLARELANRPSVQQKAGRQLQELLQQTLAKEPAARPTASEFAKQTAEILSQLGAALPTEQPDWLAIARRKVATWPNSRWLLGATITGMIILVAILWQLLTMSDQLISVDANTNPPATVFQTENKAAPTLISITPISAPPPTLLQRQMAPTLIPTTTISVQDQPTLLPVNKVTK